MAGDPVEIELRIEAYVTPNGSSRILHTDRNCVGLDQANSVVTRHPGTLLEDYRLCDHCRERGDAVFVVRGQPEAYHNRVDCNVVKERLRLMRRGDSWRDLDLCGQCDRKNDTNPPVEQSREWYELASDPEVQSPDDIRERSA